MNVLFMCVANSARSQMAEGLARKLLGDQVRVESAGSAPGKLNPFTVKAMQEIEIDISSHRPKSVDELPPEFIQNLELVITLCAEEVCPVILTRAKKLRWPFADPAATRGSDEDVLESFRRVRDEIRSRIAELEIHAT